MINTETSNHTSPQNCKIIRHEDCNGNGLTYMLKSSEPEVKSLEILTQIDDNFDMPLQELVDKLLKIRKNAANFIIRNYRIFLIKKRLRFYAVINRLILIRKINAIIIQRYARGWLVRKDLSFLKGIDNKRLIRWRHGGKDVKMIGNFTEPTWKEKINLRYSKYLKEFISTVVEDRKLPEGTYCVKFNVDGSWVCDGDLAVSQDQLGNYNNIIIVKDKAKKLSRSMSVRSFNAVIDSELSKQIITEGSQSPLILARTLSGNLDSPRGFGLIRGKNKKAPVALITGAAMCARPKKKSSPVNPQGSADAYFINYELQAFGLADGVGEWSSYGLDESRFSKELIRYCEDVILETISQNSGSAIEYCDLLEQVALEAHRRVISYGSSTLLLCIFYDSMLHSYCLGDSSFLVLRPRENNKALYSVYRSLEQQHSFNCPYQLSNLPKSNKFQELIEQGFGRLINLLSRTNHTLNDSALDAQTEMIPLKVGDIIIAGTDGLFDNLYEEDIIKSAESMLEFFDDPQDFADNLAHTLVEKAIFKGWDKSYKSPFARNASKAGKRFIGGKLDDTTIIVSVAVDKEQNHS